MDVGLPTISPSFRIEEGSNEAFWLHFTGREVMRRFAQPSANSAVGTFPRDSIDVEPFHDQISMHCQEGRSEVSFALGLADDQETSPGVRTAHVLYAGTKK
jgi:hypothetical protein